MNYSKLLETMDITQAFREAHKGAYLLHQSEPYHVKSLDLNKFEARVEETDKGYHTIALKTVELFVDEIINERNHGVSSGRARIVLFPEIHQMSVN